MKELQNLKIVWDFMDSGLYLHQELLLVLVW